MRQQLTPNFSVWLAGLVFLCFYVFMQFNLFNLRLLIDSGVLLFLMTLKQSFDITQLRALLGFNQLLPVLAAKLELPLQWVAIGYVVNDTLIYPLFFLLFTLYFRALESALALLVGYFVVIKYHFFIIPYDVSMALPLLLLLFTLQRRQLQVDKRLWFKVPIAVSILFLLVYAHPLVSISFGLVWLHTMLNSSQRFEQYKLLFLFGVFSLLMLTKWWHPEPYDLENIMAIGGGKMGRANLKLQLLMPYYYPVITAVTFAAMAVVAWWIQAGQYRKMVAPTLAALYTIAVYIIYGVYLDYPLGHWAIKTFTPAGILFVYMLANEVRNMRYETRRKVLTYGPLILIPLMAWEFAIIGTQLANTFKHRLAVVNDIINQVPDEEHSKYYYHTDSLDNFPGYKLITAGEITFTAALRHSRKYAINVVAADADRIDLLQSLNTDQYLVNAKNIQSVHTPNPYYQFKPGAYKPINLQPRVAPQ